VSIILTRALFDGWLKVWSVTTMVFPLGVCFMIFSMRVAFDSDVFPMSITLYWGVLFLGIVFVH